MWSSKEGTEASRSGSFKNGQEWGKKCFEDLDQRSMERPATRTWCTHFLLREGSIREEIGKCFKNKSIPLQRRRRLLQVLTGTFPCGQQMQKYGYRKTAACMLCQKAHEECGNSWNGELPKETIGHIQSAGCLGQRAMRGSGSCYKKSMCTGRRIGTCDSSQLRRKAGWAHSGITKGVINFARRKSCGKQREMKK
jgi:hypothetical protein